MFYFPRFIEISVHVIGLHDVTATVGKTPLCKIWKSADPKKLLYIHLNNAVLYFTEFKKNILKFIRILLNFKRPCTEFSICGQSEGKLIR